MEAHTVTGERQRVRREGEEYLARYPEGRIGSWSASLIDGR